MPPALTRCSRQLNLRAQPAEFFPDAAPSDCKGEHKSANPNNQTIRRRHFSTALSLFFSSEPVCGQTGATNSVRHIGPPRYDRVSDFTNVGASPPKIQTCESGGSFP